MMTALQILEPVTRPRLIAQQYIACLFSGAISNPGALAAGVRGSKTPRRPSAAAALTETYSPLADITGILVDLSQLIRCELCSCVLCGVYRCPTTVAVLLNEDIAQAIPRASGFFPHVQWNGAGQTVR